jgi:hypothetical protein
MLSDGSEKRAALPSLSIRYATGRRFDARSALIRLFAFAQRKRVVILDSNPQLCGEVLASSETKGTFLEHLIATPAWNPIYSIESVDGDLWRQLAHDFKAVMSQLRWRERLTPLTRKYSSEWAESALNGSVVDAESVARLTLRVLFELVFERRIGTADETLFYEASLEWRKEIAVKGSANRKVKAAFWARLKEFIEDSPFRSGLTTYAGDPSRWLSLFAQPLLISPQINISDIFVAVFRFLRADQEQMARARAWAQAGDKPRLAGVLLESIRLQHPFPILERELPKDAVFQGHRYLAGTQFFILMDQFRQDQRFDPERWLAPAAQNPYTALPFTAGPRMCAGKPIAMELMVELLRSFLTEFPEDRLQPQIGHLYSGRDNDGKTNRQETLYQLRVFARGLWLSVLIGLGIRPRTGRCPFPH